MFLHGLNYIPCPGQGSLHVWGGFDHHQMLEIRKQSPSSTPDFAARLHPGTHSNCIVRRAKQEPESSMSSESWTTCESNQPLSTQSLALMDTLLTKALCMWGMSFCSSPWPLTAVCHNYLTCWIQPIWGGWENVHPTHTIGSLMCAMICHLHFNIAIMKTNVSCWQHLVDQGIMDTTSNWEYCF